jgi:prolyl oligopeptidase
MGLKAAIGTGILSCAVVGTMAMAQSQQQQQQQQSSHLGQVARRHGEEANPANGSNNIVPLQHTLSPAAGQVRGGNGVSLADPPATAKHPVTETLGGETIPDDYRWLEQQHDPAVRAWIDQQNAYTDGYLQQVKIRPEIQAELTKLERVDTYSIPMKRGDLYFFKKRLADENQGSIYVRQGTAGADERLVDATKLSNDQNTSVNILDVTNDGSLLAYGIRQGGADEQEVRVVDVAERKELPDRLPSQRYMGVQISPDKTGLYYAVFHHSGTLVYWHAFGTDASGDKMIFGKEYKGEPLGELDLVGVSMSDNGHWLILDIARGVPPKRQDILIKDLRAPDAEFTPVIYGVDNRFELIDTGTDTFLIKTDMGAPKGQILRADLNAPPQQWQTIVPENDNVIEATTVLGGKLFVERLVDVKNEISIYTLDGRPQGTVKLPGIGTATVPYGRPLDKEGFYSFTSFNVPPTIYRYQADTGGTSIFARAKVPFHPELYGAIVCGYPLLDMLRYQNFEFGRLWTTEYGSADNAADYKYLRTYSPYQNVKQGVKYPAIMFFSGDNDTRVDPLHARKMTAEMQAATGGDRPILLHYSLKGGHSSGVSVTQQIQDDTDMLSFLWNEVDTR